ncbi:MAG: TOMM precursor leader peptide-binding protein [Acidobacteriota bacterium]
MPEDRRLRSFTVQLIEQSDGVLILRGNRRLRVTGEGAAEATQIIFTATSEDGIPLEQLLELFPGPDRDPAEKLIERLLGASFLIYSDGPLQPPLDRMEDEQDIFYWTYGVGASTVRKNLDQFGILVAGVNRITRRLCEAIQLCGISKYQVIDDNLLRNARLFDADGRLRPEEWPSPLHAPIGNEGRLRDIDLSGIGCLIAASDAGGQYYLRDWNRYCVDNKLVFLPVVLRDAVGLVGPIVVPGDTACLECLRLREDSNLGDPPAMRAGEAHAFHAQIVNGMLPSMASILGDIAAMETVKFFSRLLPWRVGHLVEVNLMAPELQVRRVLRVPRCPVCGPLSRTPSQSPLKLSFVPANYTDYTDAK